MDFSTRAKAVKAWEQRNPVEAQGRRQLERVGNRLENEAGNAAARVAQRAANWAAKNPEKVAAGAIAVGATVAAVTAGASAYFLTRLSTEGARLGREAKVQLVNQLYRDAVSKMRRELGRNPTVEEIKPLAAEWRRRLAEAEAGTPTMQRPGRE